MSSIWEKSAIGDFFSKVFSHFMLSTYLSYAGWSSYIIVLYIILGFLFLLVLFGVVITLGSTRGDGNQYSLLVTICRLLIYGFLSILYIPIIQYFFSVVDCYTPEGSTEQIHKLFKETCWTSIHMIHSIFSLVGLLLFSFWIALSSFLFHGYDINSSNPFNRY